MTSVYRAGTIKRRRRTKDQVAQLDDQILDVLREDHPQSVRHVFYRMTDPRLPEPVEKSERGYRHVQHRVKELRRAGVLPYGWISDTTRRGYHVDTFDGADDFVRRVAGLYRADLWAMSDWHVEVWVESRSIAGVLQDTCEELAVSLYPTGGFSSLTLCYEAAEYLNAVATDRAVLILYVGDHDPAGVLIDQHVERELREHLDPGIFMQFVRLGITPDQIAEYDLPTKPRKAGDKRSLHITETVEAEAMPASVLRGIVREAVESLLPENALAVAKAAEASERQHLLQLANLARKETDQ
jgi:hypothetical protein